MNFKQKADRLENFDFNVKPSLHNEIKSKSSVTNEFGLDHSNAGHMFNFVCTQIIFKDYLEHNKMKVNKLQVLINDLYCQFVKEISAKRSSKNLPPNHKRNRHLIFYEVEYYRQYN